MDRTKKHTFFELTIILVLLSFISCLLIFFTFGNISDDISIKERLLSNLDFIILAIVSTFVITSFSLIIKKIKLKNNIKDKYIFILSIILSGVYILLFSKILPFSPSNDSNTIYKAIQNNGVLTGELKKYFDFYVINKIVMYIYLIPSRIMGNPILAIKIVNFIFIYGTCIFTTLLSKNIFEKANKYITLLLITIFLPYGLLTMPYVYQITIFFISLSVYLYTLNKTYTKFLAFILSSVVYILRPTNLIMFLSLIFFYILYEFFNKKKYLIRVLDIFLMMFIAIIIKMMLGYVLYINKLIPYPNFENPIVVWSEYVGTRYESQLPTKTGRWKNPPDYYNKYDILAEGFGNLWDDIGNGKLEYTEYKKVEALLHKKIIQRFRYTVLTNLSSSVDYIKNKFYNLYNNSLSLYLYAPIVYNDTLMKEFEYNYQEKYNLVYNAFIYIFIISSLVFLIKSVIKIIKKKDKLSKDDYVNISLIFTVFITTLLYVIVLEVTKRYTLDFYIPMLLIISYKISILINKLQEKSNDLKNSKRYIFMLILILIFSVFSIYKIINKNNNKNFVNAKFYITNINENKQILHLYFPKINEGDNIIFNTLHDRKHVMKEGIWNEVPFYNNEGIGLILTMTYNDKKSIYIKRYSNMNNINK